VEKSGRFLGLIDKKATSFTLEEGQVRVPVYSETFKLPLVTEIFNFSFQHSEIKTLSLSKKIKSMSYPINTLLLNDYKVFYLETNDASQIYPENWYKERFGGDIYNGNLTEFYTFHIFPQRYSLREKTIYYIEDATITFTYENIVDEKKTIKMKLMI